MTQRANLCMLVVDADWVVFMHTLEGGRLEIALMEVAGGHW